MSAAAVRIADDVLMLVVDDEAVVFSESRQELHSLNTAATYIWCLLEDGDAPERIVDRYANTFHVSQVEARHHVHSTLGRWFALGYISEPPISLPPTTPFTRALAFLLTNVDLRRGFRASPRRACELLGVTEADRDALLGLDPDALDAQSDEIAAERARRRRPSDPNILTADADLCARASHALTTLANTSRSSTPSRLYRLLRTTFRVYAPPEVDACMRSGLEHLVTPDAPDADTVAVHAIPLGAGYLISDGVSALNWCTNALQVVACLQTVLRRIAGERHRYFIEIHAGVVRLGERCVLMSGAAGSGKSTLTAALAASGATYFSDEVALLERGTLDVAPMPFAMTIKAGSVEPLLPYYPDLAMLPEFTREDHQTSRLVAPPMAARCGVDATPCQARWIVFPRYRAGIDTTLAPVGTVEALRRLMDEALVLPELLDRDTFTHLIRWIRGRECYDLQFSSLADAVRIVNRLQARP